MSKREVSHFDDEIVFYGDNAYLRASPEGLNRRVEISLGIKKTATQKDILRRKREVLDSIIRLGGTGGKNTFELVAPLYIKEREKEALNPKHLSARTLKETQGLMYNHLIPFFGKKRIEKIDQALFDDYCFCKKEKDINLVNHRKVLSHFLKWCVRKNYLRYKSELLIPKGASKPRREREVLTDEEVKRFFENADGKILLYISFYILMGMRNMEICKLRWDEIDFEKKSLFVNPLNNRRRKMRVIPINSFVLKLLKSKRNEAMGDWVFPSARKNGKKPHLDPAGGIRKQWLKLLRAASITKHITPHDMRSTFETFMHTNPNFTDTQREKMAGAKIDVQKDIYVKMQAEQLRGLENSVQIEGLSAILKDKAKTAAGGNAGGKQVKKKGVKRASV